MTATTLHQLHYTTTTTPLRYNYDYSCSTPHYIQQLWVRWPLQPLQPLQLTRLQPPFSQSVDSLCHLWFTTTNLSYRFPLLKLPPPPRAVLLVKSNDTKSTQKNTWLSKTSQATLCLKFEAFRKVAGFLEHSNHLVFCHHNFLLRKVQRLSL